MRINTNLTAMNTFTQYTKNNNKIASSVEKLSSGYAINSAADNAAGLAISEKMRAQIRGLDQASSNSQDAISLVQTAEGNLSESTEILQRMRELAVQSSSDTNNDEIDREALQDEFQQLQAELDDIAKNATFNKKNLLDGSLSERSVNLSNVSLAQSGLSIQLGNATTGNYGFSVGVQQESAAIEGSESTFTATSTSSSFTAGTVSNQLGESSLANGNYTIKASYDEANKQMTFKATGDNGQTFTATLNASDLKAAYGTGGTKTATLNFSNGSTSAFSFSLSTASTYDTTNSTTMSTLASDISQAVTLSATGGVDAQSAAYGVYANLTGAESVKLEVGMDSVTFSNGVKVNFGELTTSSVSTANTATVSGSGTGIAKVANTSSGIDVTYSNLKVPDNFALSDGDLTISVDGTAGLKTTVGTTTYNAAISAEDLAALSFVSTEANDATKTISAEFVAADGTSFTMDITSQFDLDTGHDISASLASLAGTATVADAGHTFDATFGTTASTFGVVSKAGEGLTFQVGANEGDSMTIYIDEMNANYLGVSSASVGTQSAAATAIDYVDSAINQVSSQRAYLGAVQNRLDHKIANLNTSSENLTSAESQIRDVDMAKEMTNFTNANILQQAATAMLAQANSLPQNVLSLLG